MVETTGGIREALHGSAAPMSLQCEEAGRVDGLAVTVDFQVQVRTGRATGGANGGNLLTLPDQIALLHVERVGMGVTGLVTTGVADLDHVAVRASATGKGDHTGAHCVERRGLAGREV